MAAHREKAPVSDASCDRRGDAPGAHVDLGYVPEGHLAEDRGPGRTWVAPGDGIKVWVEGSPSQATDPCRPVGATEIRRLECSEATTIIGPVPNG